MKWKPIALFACLTAMPTVSHAIPSTQEDLRGGIRVGMEAQSLPAEGYKDFVCAGPGGRKLESWTQWATCPAGPDGLHALGAAVDDPRQEQTMIAGHPVNLTFAFDDHGRLKRIDIDTAGDARLFVRKKAYLLGLQARARYGEDGWECRNEPLAKDEEAIGETAINEHCVKTAGDREMTVERKLFRKVGSDPKAFTNESRVVIVWKGESR